MIEAELDVNNRPQIRMVEVINHNEFTIRDMFNGIPVEFPPDEKVDVTLELAAHCFAFYMDEEGNFPAIEDRAQHIASRYGFTSRQYLKPEEIGDQQAKYVKLAAKIELRPVYYKMVRADPDAPIPLDTGDEEADRVQPTLEPDTSTRVGKRKGARPKRGARGDRHRIAAAKTGRGGQRIRLG